MCLIFLLHLSGMGKQKSIPWSNQVSLLNNSYNEISQAVIFFFFVLLNFTNNSIFFLFSLSSSLLVSHENKKKENTKDCDIKLIQSNSLSSSNSGAYVCIILFIKLGQTKVRYLRVEIFIKQDISSLDVSMNNLQSRFFMEKGQTSCYTNTNLLSHWPIQFQPIFFWPFNQSN
jgi:hypothetical protein